MTSMPFDFEMPVSFFEKADAEPGKEKRIGGIASLETKDRQDERVLQRGLDFESSFLDHGWFNDNHSRETDGILGYPEKVQFFDKGAQLPDGKEAEASGHWVEGYLLDTDKAKRIWALGKALQKTKRRLGFSVEGKIQRRTGPEKKTIAKALVRNVAITNCPVHAGARMEILAKSLQVVEQTEPGMLEKALAMGTPTPATAIANQGPQTGAGAGQVMTGESLESVHNKPVVVESKKDKDEKEKEKKVKKSMTEVDAFAWYRAQLPNATPLQIGRLIQLTQKLSCSWKKEKSQ